MSEYIPDEPIEDHPFKRGPTPEGLYLCMKCMQYVGNDEEHVHFGTPIAKSTDTHCPVCFKMRYPGTTCCEEK